MNADSAGLRALPLFAGLQDKDLAEMLEVSRPCRYPKGSLVFNEGDPGDFLLVLISGRAKVVLQSERGQELILSVVEPPEVLGHIAVLDGAPRSATVVALDAIEARRLTREHFLDLTSRNRSVLDELLKHLASHIRATNEQVRTALMFDIHGQVIRALIKRGKERDAEHVHVRPRPSHQELAQMIGKSRETVSRALGDLQRAGYVTVDSRAFVLPKRKLRRYWQD
jgi:CRP-like cAMP-binding protein